MDLRQPNTTNTAPLFAATILAQRLDTPEQHKHLFAPSTTADAQIIMEHLQHSIAASGYVDSANTADLDNNADGWQVNIVKEAAAERVQ